ncbi:MAG: PRC-barrel domain-containing protein [Pyrinomonadaceae bacterium]
MRAHEFQYMEVVTESGRFLGHVFDLRSRGEPEYGEPHAARVVGEIVYGRLGLFERLGLTQAEPKTVSWEAVKAIRENKLVVDDSVGEENRG